MSPERRNIPSEFAKPNVESIKNAVDARPMGKGGAKIRVESGKRGVRADKLKRSTESRMHKKINKHAESNSIRMGQYRELLEKAMIGATSEELKQELAAIYSEHEEALSEGGFLSEDQKNAIRRKLERMGVDDDETDNLWDQTVDVLSAL